MKENKSHKNKHAEVLVKKNTESQVYLAPTKTREKLQTAGAAVQEASRPATVREDGRRDISTAVIKSVAETQQAGFILCSRKRYSYFQYSRLP